MASAYGAAAAAPTPTVHITRRPPRRSGRAGWRAPEYLPERRSHGSGPKPRRCFMANDAPPDTRRHFPAPPANKGLLVLAGVLLAIPIVALMLVNTYAKKEPVVGGFPFFFWYQF